MFDIPHKAKHQATIEFKTNIVQKSKGHEQRQAKWLNPKMSVDLSFENTPQNTEKLRDFFTTQKGDYQLFYWTWGVNGLDYKCFFEGDKLSQKMLHENYSESAIKLATVDDGNILRNHFLVNDSSWELTDTSISSQKINYNGIGNITQKDVLKIGESYTLSVISEHIAGDMPILSSDTSANDLPERTLASGQNKIEFVASGKDFGIELKDSSIGNLRDFKLCPKYTHATNLAIAHKIEHTHETNFKTLRPENTTNLQYRRSMWDSPINRWVLDFELNPKSEDELRKFFISQKGCYKSFLWNDGSQDYNVRFDSDALEIQYLEMGYAQVKIPIIEAR